MIYTGLLNINILWFVRLFHRKVYNSHYRSGLLSSRLQTLRFNHTTFPWQVCLLILSAHLATGTPGDKIAFSPRRSQRLGYHATTFPPQEWWIAAFKRFFQTQAWPTLDWIPPSTLFQKHKIWFWWMWDKKITDYAESHSKTQQIPPPQVKFFQSFPSLPPPGMGSNQYIIRYIHPRARPLWATSGR